MCRLVGCRPRRLASDQGKAAQARQARVKYIIRCDACGSESKYLRRGKAVELMLRGRGKRLRCYRCGGNRFTLLIPNNT